MADPGVSPQAKAAHLASLGAMLTAERSLLADVRSEAGAVAKAAGRPPTAETARVAAILSARAMGVRLMPVLAARVATAQSSGAATLKPELDAAAVRLAQSGADGLPARWPQPSDVEADRERVRRAAADIEREYLRQAMKIISAREAAREPMYSALEASVPDRAIDTMAATEGATAFCKGRQDRLASVRQEYDGTNWLPAMFTMRDETLDRRTCPVCRNADGDVRHIGFSFDGDWPRSRHPRCRGVPVVIAVVAFMGRREKQAA